MKQKQTQDIENRLVVVTGEGDREGRIGNLGLVDANKYIHPHTYRIDK